MKRLNLSGWKPRRGFWRSLEAALRGINTRGIRVILVDGEYMKGLKKTFFGKEELSDVLTFVYDGVKEVVVCPEYLNFDEVEVAKRIIHGILHALGYDHKVKTKVKEMEGLEELILEDFLSLFCKT
ncbi:MAG: rRNA maturation RNAse YbeY [candidate division WOR-3 bacterium]